MSNTNGTKAQEFEYKAEMKQLLHLIVHSLYTNKEVFLRELVSNSSDALNKIRFRRLTDQNIIDPEADLKIDVYVDKEKGTIAIEDTGIGMTQEDLVSRIGTVASSGTLEFLNKMKEEKQTLDAGLIGQFGVGFYSVFMVTDSIVIETRHADKDSKAYRWESVGEDRFSITEIDRTARGTKIIFTLNEDAKEFANPERIKSILNKYSNFVDFPVYVDGEEVNKVKPLWQRSKDEIKDEELKEFYKYVSNDFQDPLGHIQLNIEGNINFKALIFIPSYAPPAMFTQAQEKTLQLYSNRVFIQDDCKELLPDYLKFLKGVIDTEDLPLNVSREVTQSSPLIAKIKNVVTSKILGLLEEWAKDDKEKYETFFKQFGSMFKTGVNTDFSNKERITDLLRYETSAGEPGELVSLRQYVDRMKDDQKEIYFLSGDHRDFIERNPNIEYFKKKELEVIYLTDPVDVFTFPYITEYDSKPIKSIEKADIEIEKDDSDGVEKLDSDHTRMLIDSFKKVLGDSVEDVIESKRLVDSPATLVVGAQGMDPQMEKMMSILNQDYSGSKRILEINTKHNIIKNISNMSMNNPNDPRLESSIRQLFEGALLLEGQLKSPVDFIKRMNEFMEKATS